MPQVDISPDLFRQIDQTRPESVSMSEFVAQAVREKLDKEHDMERLELLVSQNRQAMFDRGLTEEDVLADFEAWRRGRHE